MKDLKRQHIEAETLQRLIDNGSLTVAELPLLVNLGLAIETVNYYYAWRSIPKLIEKF
jgi:hypothetical protein